MSLEESSLTPEAILEQLERILCSPAFSSAPQLQNFLRYVVTETLDGRARRIKQYTVATGAFGRADDFDPEADPIVRITARRLRRTLLEYYSSEGAEDPIRIEIPKGTYVPTFAPNISLDDRDKPDSSLRLKEKKGEYVAAEVDSGPTVAVVAFRNLSEEPEHTYFATGLTERITTILSGMVKFSVMGPLSREKLAQQQLTPADIGREYGVRFVLEGQVRWHNGMVRINARLTDAKKQINIWAKTYDAEVASTSLFEVEDEVSSQIASILASGHGVIPRTLARESFRKSDHALQVYDAVLRFYHAYATMATDAFHDAEQALRRIIDLDPQQALPIGMLADLYAEAYLEGREDAASDLDESEKLARRAVALDPTNQIARLSLAMVHYYRGRRASFIREAEAAINLNPGNASVLGGIAQLLTYAGQYDRGMALMQKAMRLNPHHPRTYYYVPFLGSTLKQLWRLTTEYYPEQGCGLIM